MNTTYPAPPIPAEYQPAMERFHQMLYHLEERKGADHRAIESLLEEEGHEVLRLAFQGWLDARRREEVSQDVVGEDGKVRTHHREASRVLETLFGSVEVRRDQVSGRGMDGRAPMDAALNLPRDSFSFGVRQRVAEAAAISSYDATSKMMSSTSGAEVAKLQAEVLVRHSVVDFETFYVAQRNNTPVWSSPLDLLVLSADGKGIIMRPDGLREQTRKAAEKARPKLVKRTSKGEKKNRKRMATVAAVYSLPLQPRTAADVIGELNGGTPATNRPRAQHKRVWASIERDARTVIEEMFVEADLRDPEHTHPWVVLVDGNATQIRAIRTSAKKHGVEVTLVLDFIHVTEYLWDAAWCFFKEGDPQAEAWVDERRLRILEGGAVGVAAGMRSSATKQGLQKRDGVDKAAAYILGHADMMRYDEYLKAGMPIATGVIEGACRHLVRDRMDATGARWGLVGAEAILKIRSLRSSGDLANYWAFHHHAEWERNHASRYATSELPMPTRKAA